MTGWVPVGDTVALPGVAAANSAQESGNGFRILLVEDNEINQKVAFHSLRKLGHTVDVVSSGREAIEAYQRHRYPLILMDANMPDLDGYETTRLIREMEGNSRRTAIVALTANAMPGDRELCIQAGMDDYIPKPIQWNTFGRTIGQ